MRLLLLSSSRTPEDDSYLAHARDAVEQHINGSKEVLFIPFAGVTVPWDPYTDLVRGAFAEIGVNVRPLHKQANPVAAIQNAEAIVVGGGNTFRLVNEIHQRGLLEPLRDCIRRGASYMGWSAGSNLACPGLFTTNDMPIVQPPSFEALGLVEYQLNPHYTDVTPEGHRGETRDQRLSEFLEMNPETMVIGLREGSWLEVRGKKTQLRGKAARRFRYGNEPTDMIPGPVDVA